MNAQNIINRLTAHILSYDENLEAVANVVRQHSFLTLRVPLEKLGIGKVSMMDSGDCMMWKIQTRRGKIGIVSRRCADTVSRDDIIVGNFVVGYL